MNLNNYYWWFKSALPHKLCDDIIKFALIKQEQLAITGGYDNKKLTKKDIKNLKKKRNSHIVWLDENWIYKEIVPYIQIANQMAGWNFQIDFSEKLQFTKYKLNQYYDWHCDSWQFPYNKPNSREHGKIRKLSMTCQLSDGSEYKGGELEFNFQNLDMNKKQNIRTATEILPKGSIVVFPSFVWHRVKPVTNGTRYSLVSWNLGEPFK